MTRQAESRAGERADPAAFPIPGQRAERDRLRAVVDHRNADRQPQLTLDELAAEAAAVCAEAGAAPRFAKWVMVLVNNRTWHSHLAAVPRARRLLLLPQCLRDPDGCPARMDELGLLCQGCGRCPLGALKAEAETLGYLVVISEGTSAVLALVKSGQIDAFVGSSCLPTLERVFPVMAFVGLPAVAIPLLGCGCLRTDLDLDWLQEAMRL